MGKGINYENRFHKIGKVYFVENIIRDEFFRKNNIKIHSSFIGEKEGLADEIDSFKKIPNPSGTYTYRGVKSKDDIVFSLMIALYVAYVEILRDEYIRLE
jgi:hypothetical protein